jgi:hypothetical protein
MKNNAIALVLARPLGSKAPINVKERENNRCDGFDFDVLF